MPYGVPEIKHEPEQPNEDEGKGHNRTIGDFLARFPVPARLIIVIVRFHSSHLWP